MKKNQFWTELSKSAGTKYFSENFSKIIGDLNNIYIFKLIKFGRTPLLIQEIKKYLNPIITTKTTAFAFSSDL